MDSTLVKLPIIAMKVEIKRKKPKKLLIMKLTWTITIDLNVFEKKQIKYVNIIMITFYN